MSGNPFPRRLGPGHEYAAVGEEMGAHGVEATLPRRAEGGDHVPLEEVGAGGETDGVADAGLEEGGLCGEEVEGLEDGGGVGVLEELDEGFDGGDGHG